MPDYVSVYERARRQLIARMIPEGSGLGVDIGCSDGHYSAILRSKGYGPVHGYDTDALAIERARAVVNADFEVGQDNFSLQGRAITLALEILEHLPAAQQFDFLRSIRSVTKPNGILVLSTPGRYSLFATWQRLRGVRRHRLVPYDWWDPTHVSVVSFRRLRRLLLASGFDIIEMVGYCYGPPHRFAPRSFKGLLARGGFDLIALCRVAPDRGSHSIGERV